MFMYSTGVKSAPSFNMLLKYCHGMECIITVDCFCIEASPIAECHNTEVCIWQKKYKAFIITQYKTLLTLKQISYS